jgi:hypothetical protein
MIYARKPKIDSRSLKMGSAGSSLSRVERTKSNDARSRIKLLFLSVRTTCHTAASWRNRTTLLLGPQHDALHNPWGHAGSNDLFVSFFTIW